MNTDFRLCIGFQRHHKTRRLRHSLGAEAVLALLDLWDYAAQFRPDGILTGMSDDDIEGVVGWEGDRGAFVHALASIGFLDGGHMGGNGGHSDPYSLHHWVEHNGWAAESDDRSGEARFSALKRWKPEVAKTLDAAGITSLTTEEYGIAKKKGADAVINGRQCPPHAPHMGTHKPPNAYPNGVADAPSPLLSNINKEERENACAREANADPPASIPDDMPDITFEEWWASYPRKEGKEEAWGAWKTMKAQRKLPGLNMLLDALAMQTQSEPWTQDGGRFIPSPAKYLRGGHWSDELPMQRMRTEKEPRATTVAQQGAVIRDQLAKTLLAKQQGGMGRDGKTGIDRTGLIEPGRALRIGQEPGRADDHRAELAGGPGGNE